MLCAPTAARRSDPDLRRQHSKGLDRQNYTMHVKNAEKVVGKAGKSSRIPKIADLRLLPEPAGPHSLNPIVHDRRFAAGAASPLHPGAIV